MYFRFCPSPLKVISRPYGKVKLNSLLEVSEQGMATDNIVTADTARSLSNSWASCTDGFYSYVLFVCVFHSL